MELDTLRSYNGYIHELHEFQVPRDQNGRLVVTEDPKGSNVGTVEWERISLEARVQWYADHNVVAAHSGDVKYVVDVEKQVAF